MIHRVIYNIFMVKIANLINVSNVYGTGESSSMKTHYLFGEYYFIRIFFYTIFKWNEIKFTIFLNLFTIFNFWFSTVHIK